MKVEHQRGGPKPPKRAPGHDKPEAVTFERGLTHDPEFVEWASRIWSGGTGDPAMSLEGFRRDFTVEMVNEVGRVVRRSELRRCWTSEFTVLPDPEQGRAGVAIETLKLEMEDLRLEGPSGE